MALEVEIEKRLPGFTLEVSFTAEAQPVGILGPSGAGKSMTLRSIAGVEDPTRGRIALDGRVLFDSARGIRVPSRARRVGLLFQHYALFPHLTVQENVQFGVRHLPSGERAARVSGQIAAAHVAGLERRYPATLSGGEQQRVALARALAPQPAALLLDEPFSALDTYLRSQLERQLRESLAGYRQPTLLVSHNLEELYRLCAELVVLDRGRMIARGPRQDIFHRPPSRRVAELTGCKNFSRARATGDHEIEALDWGCRLRVAQPIPPRLSHCGIRAHHIEIGARPSSFVASAVRSSHAPHPDWPGLSRVLSTIGAGEDLTAQERSAPPENTARGWVVDATEGPFAVTLYLRLHQPPPSSSSSFSGPEARSDYHLQAEIPRERWEQLQKAPQPYLVWFDPSHVMLLPD